MELEKSGGVTLFIINSIISRTRERKWIRKKWVEKKTLENIFDVLAKKGIEIYTHFEFGNPWETFDSDLALFVEVGWIEVESDLIQKSEENEESKITIKERVRICLTEKGRKMIENSKLYFPEHQKIMEEVINDIVLTKN